MDWIRPVESLAAPDRFQETRSCAAEHHVRVVDRQHGSIVGEPKHEAAMNEPLRVHDHRVGGVEGRFCRAFAEIEDVPARGGIGGQVGPALHGGPRLHDPGVQKSRIRRHGGPLSLAVWAFGCLIDGQITVRRRVM